MFEVMTREVPFFHIDNSRAVSAAVLAGKRPKVPEVRVIDASLAPMLTELYSIRRGSIDGCCGACIKTACK